MLELARAVRSHPGAGEPLVVPWAKLAEVATPRRGQMALIYGPAGSCKSMLALNLVLAWEIPCLYLSPDTDQHDTAMRCIASKHGLSTAQIEGMLDADVLDMSSELAYQRDWLRWSFDPSPTLDDVELEMLAFEEQFGAMPELVVVDTISDVTVNDDDEFGSLRKVMKEMHALCRAYNTAVIVITHSTGEYDSDVKPAPRRAINGKLSKVPELIWSIARNGEHLGIATVKQRQGDSDPLAQKPIWLSIRPDRAEISDPPEIYATATNWSN